MLCADSGSCVSPSGLATDPPGQPASPRVPALDELQRAWLRRRLHDDLAQCLSFALIRLDVAREGAPAECGQVLLQARQLVRQSLQVARDTLRELDEPDDPHAGDPLHLGLTQAASEVMALSGRRIDVDCPPITQTVPVAVASILIRAVRELLINACKHATGARIHLCAAGRDGHGLTLWVSDDGPGVDLANAHDPPGHYGLHRLPEQLALAGVELRVRSMPGHGLSARLRWCPPPMAGADREHRLLRSGETQT